MLQTEVHSGRIHTFTDSNIHREGIEHCVLLISIGVCKIKQLGVEMFYLAYTLRPQCIPEERQC